MPSICPLFLLSRTNWQTYRRPLRGEVSPSKNLIGGGLLPSEDQVASRLDPKMCTFHAHPGLVWMMRALGLASLREADFPRDLRRIAMRIRCRSYARTHSHMQRLASLKA